MPHMLGAAGKTGENRRCENTKGRGKSFLAFDFQRELLVIKSQLQLQSTPLPPALRPVDAELAFDDIPSQGIRLDHVPKQVRDRNGNLVAGYKVTVTVSCRRPPKFYTEFEQTDDLLGRDQRDPKKGPYRRRATAMDFTTSGTICL